MKMEKFDKFLKILEKYHTGAQRDRAGSSYLPRYRRCTYSYYG